MPARLSAARPVRVASVPGAHPYIRSLLGPSGAAIEVLPDPPALDGAVDRWWPPAMLTRAWVETHADEFDLMHLHFGLESSSTAALADLLAALSEARKPVVFTVHDLVNPQLSDQRHHDEQLDLLIPAADHLTTLTAGAGREIERRWGRAATLIRHPHVAPLEGAPAAGVSAPVATVVVHLRDLRPNIDGAGIVRALADAADPVAQARRARPVRIVVDVNERVRDDEQLRQIADIVAAAPLLSLRRHPRYDDAALAASLAAADVAVLPYRFGTHSGWVELCWDLGVPVVTAPVGHMAEQHPDDAVVYDPDAIDGLATALARALGAATASGSAERHEVVVRRRRERTLEGLIIAGQHERIYRELLA